MNARPGRLPFKTYTIKPWKCRRLLLLEQCLNAVDVIMHEANVNSLPRIHPG
jgi:hypothetical protein